MWSIENGKMKLDISKVRSDFKIVSANGLHLVHPRKNLWEWEGDEKYLRSVVVDDDGFVVSCSWKKFGNYGEFRDETTALVQALRNGGTVHFSHKHDGSLCIRSVYNKNVIMRTRGTLFGGEDNDEQITYGERFRKVAQIKYPILLDPKFMTDRSLLFEYVAPSNLVVIRYKEEDLIFLGYIKHDDLRVGQWHEVEKIAKDFKFNLVELHDLPRDPHKLLEEIKIWKDEGIVARCDDDQVFVKVKSAYYLASHRMKFSMNYLTMVEFIEGGEIQSESQLIDNLRSCDFDWEIIESAKEFYSRYTKAYQLKEAILTAAKNFFVVFEEKWNVETVEPKKRNWQWEMDTQRVRKKEFALLLNKTDFDELPVFFVRTIAFALYDDRQEQIHNFCRKIILTEGKK
ncbi:MAG: hypothetical protein WC516_04965 [Patescibacteria group bacterium]|jgi:hypothetical protein